MLIEERIIAGFCANSNGDKTRAVRNCRAAGGRRGGQVADHGETDV